MRKLVVVLMSTFGLLISNPAFARHHSISHPRPFHHHRYHTSARTSYRADGRPAAWCGWYMRKLLGVADPSYNLARNWAHWGHAGAPGGGGVGVCPPHVGKIVGRAGSQWVVQSGNDGHAVRTRPRSIAGAIAIRWGGGYQSFASVDNSWNNNWARREDYTNDNVHLTTASWYSQSRRTASGEWFRPNEMTAASRTLPFGTKVRIRYRNRTVVVRINDRGPFVRGRGLDLSRGAARALGMPGTARVSWTRL